MPATSEVQSLLLRTPVVMLSAEHPAAVPRSSSPVNSFARHELNPLDFLYILLLKVTAWSTPSPPLQQNEQQPGRLNVRRLYEGTQAPRLGTRWLRHLCRREDVEKRWRLSFQLPSAGLQRLQFQRRRLASGESGGERLYRDSISQQRNPPLCQGATPLPGCWLAGSERGSCGNPERNPQPVGLGNAAPLEDSGS